MDVAFFWEPVGGLTLSHKCNPYAGLLALELEKLDVHLELGDYSLTKTWLDENKDRVDVLHLHWLHFFYRRDTLEETVKAYSAFAESLAYAKHLGYRIVWTLHNLYPHERPFPDVDHLARLTVSRLADHVITHCDYGKRKAGELFYRQDDITILPHGNFIDAFPSDVSRADARSLLGLEQNDFVYVYFGNARTYKGIEDLLESFSAVTDDQSKLLLAIRNAFNPAYGDEIVEQSGLHEQVIVHASEYFDESEFQNFLNAADVGVFPFSQVMTSGSTIQALGFGLPVVVPDLGCLSELITEDVGLRYNAADPEGLPKALREIRHLDVAQMGKAARKKAESLDWPTIASETAKIYGQVC